MTNDEKKPGRPFLERWSQRKQAVRDTPANVELANEVDAPAPQLPPVDELTIESDFSGFLHPKVDPGLRKAALQRLFSDPHFNVMDGLDTYVDDYSNTEPLPAAMLAGLRQAQNILAWAKETKEETAARFAPSLPATLPPLIVDAAQSDEPPDRQLPDMKPADAITNAEEIRSSEPGTVIPTAPAERNS
jgi:hypothetical protein